MKKRPKKWIPMSSPLKKSTNLRPYLRIAKIGTEFDRFGTKTYLLSTFAWLQAFSSSRIHKLWYFQTHTSMFTIGENLDKWQTLATHHFFLELCKYENTQETKTTYTTSIESPIGFLRLDILNNKMVLAPNRCTQSKKFHKESHPQIKIEDGSVK